MPRTTLHRALAATAALLAVASSGVAAAPADVAPAPHPRGTTGPAAPADIPGTAQWDEAALAGDVVARPVTPVRSRRGLDPNTCPDGFAHDPVAGCLRPAGHGLVELATPDGGQVTVADPRHHGDGPDVAAAAGSDWNLTQVKPRPVACAPAHTPRAVAVYVHRPGRARLSAVADTIRTAIEKGNGAVAASARQSGGPVAALRFACTRGGRPAVVRVASRDASFGGLRQAVRNAGYDRPATKYLLFADMRSPYGGVAGMGQVFRDDRRAMDNRNNGIVAMYAAVWQPWWATAAPLHELAHTMGAVQPSAPTSYAGAHCDDSYDIMCYTHDGGACGRYVFDCRNDTYFSTAPARGSYLATHWNLGWHGNRFVAVAGRPTPNTRPTAAIRSLRCTTWTCHADGRDSSDLDGRIVRVWWQWGDGTRSSGWRSRHHFTADGAYTVRLTVVDDRGGRAAVTHRITVANQAPEAAIAAATCDGRACTFDGSGADDADGRVARWRWSVDGTAAAGRTVDHTFANDGTHEVTLTVADNDGRWSPATSRTVTVCGDTATLGQLACRTESGVADPAGTVAEISGGLVNGGSIPDAVAQLDDVGTIPNAADGLPGG